MQKLITIISLALLALSIAGCSLFKSQPTGTVFTFDYEGKTYQIVGYDEPDGESANFLVLREGDTVELRVIDRGQTGFLNEVLTGSIDIAEANRIYQAGINIAMEKELFREKERNRLFETEIDEHRTTVESYLSSDNSPRNRLSVYDLNWSLLGVYWDDGSNGIIDSVDFGDLDIENAQNLYKTALERAEKQGRLEDSDSETYIISRKNTRNPDNMPYSGEPG